MIPADDLQPGTQYVFTFDSGQGVLDRSLATFVEMDIMHRQLSILIRRKKGRESWIKWLDVKEIEQWESK